MADINGLSLIIGKGIFHIGSYKKGVWFDNNEIQDIPKEQRIGSGVKFDVCFGRNIRPIGQFWKRGFWQDDTRIQDIPKNEWDAYFGTNLANKIRKLDKSCWKYRTHNPWFAFHAFVLRLPKLTPSMFFSFGFSKIFSFYLGCKSYKIDPMPGGRDSTWTNIEDIKRALKEEPRDSYFALCPSATFRKTRMT